MEHQITPVREEQTSLAVVATEASALRIQERREDAVRWLRKNLHVTIKNSSGLEAVDRMSAQHYFNLYSLAIPHKVNVYVNAVPTLPEYELLVTDLIDTFTSAEFDDESPTGKLDAWISVDLKSAYTTYGRLKTDNDADGKPLYVEEYGRITKAALMTKREVMDISVSDPIADLGDAPVGISHYFSAGEIKSHANGSTIVTTDGGTEVNIGHVARILTSRKYSVLSPSGESTSIARVFLETQEAHRAGNSYGVTTVSIEATENIHKNTPRLEDLLKMNPAMIDRHGCYCKYVVRDADTKRLIITDWQGLSIPPVRQRTPTPYLSETTLVRHRLDAHQDGGVDQKPSENLIRVLAAPSVADDTDLSYLLPNPLNLQKERKSDDKLIGAYKIRGESAARAHTSQDETVTKKGRLVAIALTKLIGVVTDTVINLKPKKAKVDPKEEAQPSSAPFWNRTVGGLFGRLSKFSIKPQKGADWTDLANNAVMAEKLAAVFAKHMPVSSDAETLIEDEHENDIDIDEIEAAQLENVPSTSASSNSGLLTLEYPLATEAPVAEAQVHDVDGVPPSAKRKFDSEEDTENKQTKRDVNATPSQIVSFNKQQELRRDVKIFKQIPESVRAEIRHERLMKKGIKSFLDLEVFKISEELRVVEKEATEELEAILKDPVALANHVLNGFDIKHKMDVQKHQDPMRTMLRNRPQRPSLEGGLVRMVSFAELRTLFSVRNLETALGLGFLYDVFVLLCKAKVDHFGQLVQAGTLFNGLLATEIAALWQHPYYSRPHEFGVLRAFCVAWNGLIKSRLPELLDIINKSTSLLEGKTSLIQQFVSKEGKLHSIGKALDLVHNTRTLAIPQ